MLINCSRNSKGGDAVFLWAAGGDLATLVRNPALTELVGGIQRWAMGYLPPVSSSKVMQGYG